MNGNWRFALVCTSMLLALLFATDHVRAAPTNPQVLYAFCWPGPPGCTDEQKTLGENPQGVIAGPDGAYYGTTASTDTVYLGGNGDAGGSVYRADPVTRTVRAIYQFPRGYYPSWWLKTGPDGYLYGGYRHVVDENSKWISEGLFRLSPAGEFKIIFAETKYKGFSSSPPVQDSVGNWIGIVANTYTGENLDFIYKVTPGGAIKILHEFVSDDLPPDPNYEPVLAADGNLYGVVAGGTGGRSGALFRLAPDETFTILHSFDKAAEGYPQTPLTIGPDGALYGILQANGQLANTLYRMSLDGQFTNLGAFGPDRFLIRKLTLMPDGQFYGLAKSLTDAQHVFFRLSPADQFTKLYAYEYTWSDEHLYPLIRGFDNALYGADCSGGKYVGGVLFRYVPPPVQ